MQKYQQGKYVFKLIDFEASRTIGQECVGLITPRYCPPEVARATTYGIESHGVVASASVDLWSLGCIIYVSVEFGGRQQKHSFIINWWLP